VEGYRRWMAAITPYLPPGQDIEPVALEVSGSRQHGEKHD
jgi:hypothetical protein